MTIVSGMCVCALCVTLKPRQANAGIRIGPRDIPGAQLDLGMEMTVAVQGGNSERGPPRPASSGRAGGSSASTGPSGDATVEDVVIRRDGQKHIVPCNVTHGKPNRKADAEFFTMKVGDFRNRKLAAIKSGEPIEQLHDWVTQNGIKHYCLAAVGDGSEALLFDTPKTRIKHLASSVVGVPLVKDAAEVVKDMQARSETFYTVKVVTRLFFSYSKDDILSMARPYIALNGAEFQAELIAIGTRDPTTLSQEEKFILANSAKFGKLRAAIMEVDLAKSYLCYPAQDDSVLKVSQFQRLETLKARRMIEGGTVVEMPFLRAIRECPESYTFIFGGPPRCGKTPLAKAVAAEYASARGVSYFAMSSTVDSLRMLSVQGFFRPYTCVLLDEWRIGTESQDSQSHKADFIKCVTDVENPGAVRLRYSDVRFAPCMPRIITSQAKMAQWIEILSAMEPDDTAAILKRLVFVDFAEQHVPPELVKTARVTRVDDLLAAFKAVGITVPSDSTLGGWAQVAV